MTCGTISLLQILAAAVVEGDIPELQERIPGADGPGSRPAAAPRRRAHPALGSASVHISPQFARARRIIAPVMRRLVSSLRGGVRFRCRVHPRARTLPVLLTLHRDCHASCQLGLSNRDPPPIEPKWPVAIHANLNPPGRWNDPVAITSHMERLLRAFPDLRNAFCFTTSSMIRRMGIARTPYPSLSLRVDPLAWQADTAATARLAPPSAFSTVQAALEAHFEAQRDILTGDVPDNLLLDIMRPSSGPASPGRCVDVGHGAVILPFASSLAAVGVPAAAHCRRRPAAALATPSTRRVTFRIARAVCGDGAHWWAFICCDGVWWKVDDAHATRLTAEFPRAALSNFGTLFWLRRVE